MAQGKAWFDSIKDTPLKDRIFVLMLFMIFITVGYSVYITKTLSNEKNAERELRVKAESKNEDLREIIVKDNKDYTSVIAEERRDCDERWRVKFESERDFNKKLLEERARVSEERAKRFEEQLISLTKETQRVRNVAAELNEKVKKVKI